MQRPRLLNVNGEGHSHAATFEFPAEMTASTTRTVASGAGRTQIGSTVARAGSSRRSEDANSPRRAEFLRSRFHGCPGLLDARDGTSHPHPLPSAAHIAPARFPLVLLRALAERDSGVIGADSLLSFSTPSCDAGNVTIHHDPSSYTSCLFSHHQQRACLWQ